jgi:alpha-1,2-mannosyltransferase
MNTRFLLNPKLFPFATMIFQVIAAVVITFDCLIRITPDIFIDTCGIAYGYPFIKVLGGCSVVSYVHYPHISSDMMNLVREQRPSYNNDSKISKNMILTYCKLVYYIALGKLYSFVGLFADTVVVNSTWTEEHISELWSFPSTKGKVENDRQFHVAVTNWGFGILQTTRYLMKIYPPCNIEQLVLPPIEPLSSSKRQRAVLSVAQFRPEKGHILQLLALKTLIARDPKK